MNKIVYIGVITGLCLMASAVQAQQSASAHVPAGVAGTVAGGRGLPDSLPQESGLSVSDSLSADEGRPAESDSLRLKTDGIPPVDTLIVVSNVKVSRSKGDLFVAMDLDVSRLKIRNDREYHYIPHLTDGYGHELALPAAVLASRTLYYRHLRNQDLPSDVQLYDSRGLLSVAYRVTVPFDPWLLPAGLQAGTAAYPLYSLM
ncbi:MAG: hypothetical protein K2O01_08770, partial [Bacteroidales bacterium]|nr:hypothetical protein [Bacteroidales bacterium]